MSEYVIELTQNPYADIETKGASHQPSQIIFILENDIWVMKINKDGIFFNLEAYNEFTPDDFAMSIIDILEKQFNVNFEIKI